MESPALNVVLEKYRSLFKQLCNFFVQLPKKRFFWPILLLIILSVVSCSILLFNNHDLDNLRSGALDQRLIDPKLKASILNGVNNKRVYIDGFHAADPGNLSLFKELGMKAFIGYADFTGSREKLFSCGLLLMNFAIGKPELSFEEYKIVRQYMLNGGRLILLCPAWVWITYDHKDLKQLPYYQIAKDFGFTLSAEYVNQPLKITHPLFMVKGIDLGILTSEAFSSINFDGQSPAAEIVAGTDGKAAAACGIKGQAKLIVWGQNNLFRLASSPEGKEFIARLFGWLLNNDYKIKWKTNSSNKIFSNLTWDTGQKNLSGRRGRIIWNIIAALFYILLALIIYLRRKQLKSFFLNLRFGPEAILFFFASALIVWIFIPLFRAGLPASWDAAQHFVRCLVMKNIFLSNFRLDGWNPYWYLGYQQFLFYSPVLFLLIVMLNLLTFQLLPLMLCYKIFYFLLIFSLPFVSYWLLRQFKVEPFPSALAAVSAISFSAVHGFGISAIFIAGLITQGFGVILFAFILGLMLKICRPESKTNDVLWLGLLIGILFLSHVITSVYLIFCLLVLALFNLANHENIMKLAAAFLIGSLIAGFAIYSAFAFRDLKLPAVGWGDFNFFRDLITGAYFSTPLINIFALLGFIFALFDKNTERRFLAVLAFLTYFMASGILKINSGPLSNLYNEILKHRTFPYLALFFIVFSGIFYQYLLAWISNIANRMTEKRGFIKGASILLSILVISHVYIKITHLEGQIKTVAGYEDRRAAKFYDALAWIKQNTPQNIVVTMDMRMEGAPEIFSFNYINIYADRYCLNGESGIRPDNIQFDMHLADWPPEQIYQDAVRCNVSYFMTWKEDAAANLSSDSRRFHLVYDNRTVKLWQVVGHDFRYIANDNIKIDKFYFSPEEIRWGLINNKESNRVICAVSYHPNWRLRVNGRDKKIDKAPDRLMTFVIPAKGAHYDVRLKFERSNPEKLLYLVSAATLLIVVGLIIYL